MAKLTIYTSKGVKKGTMDLPKVLYMADKNLELLTQAMHVYEDRAHRGTSKVKTRGEVSGTTAKMYRQKGTGNARHGSYKAPIFKGGGITHGPKGVKRILDLSQKMRIAALRVALSLKVRDGAVVVADKLDSLIKTKDAQKLINLIRKDMGADKFENVRVVMDVGKKNKFRVFRNIKGLKVSYWQDLNAYDTFISGLLIVDRDAFLNISKTSPKTTPQATKTVLESEAKTPNPQKLSGKTVKTKGPNRSKNKQDKKEKLSKTAKQTKKKRNQKT